MHAHSNFSWWRRGDLDGFFGLFVDNLIQLILASFMLWHKRLEVMNECTRGDDECTRGET